MDHAELDLDRRVRTAAFSFLAQQIQLTSDGVLPRSLLAIGFTFDGTRVPLIGPQGIFKPAILPEIPISITTVPVVEGQARPYADEVGPNGLLLYRYRGYDLRRLGLQPGVSCAERLGNRRRAVVPL